MELKERNELSKFLRRGDKKAISELAKVDRQTLERFLKGETINSAIEPYFKAYAEKRKQEYEQRIGALEMAN